jgi:hypothetical protein
VTLRYLDARRRCEFMQGGVPGWTWAELGPMVADLDALYINFISGFELTLETARLLRRGFARFIYADLHSLFLGKEPDGTRVLQTLPEAPGWFSCFDVVQLNDEEMAQLGPDPLAIAAAALASGCQALCVTAADRGVIYFTGQPIRTARIPAELAVVDTIGDPTGCGDVFGAAAAASLVQGYTLEDALRRANRFAARNLSMRGATGLRDHLLGRLTSA